MYRQINGSVRNIEQDSLIDDVLTKNEIYEELMYANKILTEDVCYSSATESVSENSVTSNSINQNCVVVITSDSYDLRAKLNI